MKVIEFFFGCTHTRTTFPRARIDRQGKVIHPRVNYVACLKCGAEIEYNSTALDGEIQKRPERTAQIEAGERQRLVA